ncbi:CMP-N-acetylneuraminate-beta-galactosamide-alpha-2,3-sialyltransferase 1 isoform X2 [Ovis canadensis]|uniref:CMP-N-acetylneuraminate-beta-galactosamide- alpha-2,3-sialyltransferase 1 isoform X2 n=1 Tax=Ovis canadensis TaxID=37174 RepID=UPI0037504851
MPLKSCVQHLACRTGILLQSKTPAPPHFPIKDGEGDGTPLQYSCLENPGEEGPKSAKLTPKGGLSWQSGWRALLWITSQPRRVGGKKPQPAAGPGREAGPRWPLRALIWAPAPGPHQPPSPAPSTPALSPPATRAPLEEVGGLAPPPAGGSAPSRYRAPTRALRSTAASSAGFSPRATPPRPRLPSLASPPAAAVPAEPRSGRRSVPRASSVSPAGPPPTRLQSTWLGALGSARRQPGARGKLSRGRVGGGAAAGGARGREGRALGGGRGGRRAREAPARLRRAPAPGSRPRPLPGRPACLPLPFHPGEGVPETAPLLTPPPRSPGSSLRRRSSTMPDSFDTLQRQRPERGGRGGPGGRAGGERAGRGDVSRERAECSGHPRFYSPPDLLVPYPPLAPEPRKLPRVSGRDDRQPPVPSSSQLLPHHISGDSMGKTQF